MSTPELQDDTLVWKSPTGDRVFRLVLLNRANRLTSEERDGRVGQPDALDALAALPVDEGMLLEWVLRHGRDRGPALVGSIEWLWAEAETQHGRQSCAEKSTWMLPLQLKATRAHCTFRNDDFIALFDELSRMDGPTLEGSQVLERELLRLMMTIDPVEIIRIDPDLLEEIDEWLARRFAWTSLLCFRRRRACAASMWLRHYRELVKEGVEAEEIGDRWQAEAAQRFLHRHKTFVMAGKEQAIRLIKGWAFPLGARLVCHAAVIAALVTITLVLIGVILVGGVDVISPIWAIAGCVGLIGAAAVVYTLLDNYPMILWGSGLGGATLAVLNVLTNTMPPAVLCTVTSTAAAVGLFVLAGNLLKKRRPFLDRLGRSVVAFALAGSFHLMVSFVIVCLVVTLLPKYATRELAIGELVLKTAVLPTLIVAAASTATAMWLIGLGWRCPALPGRRVIPGDPEAAGRSS